MKKLVTWCTLAVILSLGMVSVLHYLIGVSYEKSFGIIFAIAIIACAVLALAFDTKVPFILASTVSLFTLPFVFNTTASVIALSSVSIVFVALFEIFAAGTYGTEQSVSAWKASAALFMKSVTIFIGFYFLQVWWLPVSLITVAFIVLAYARFRMCDVRDIEYPDQNDPMHGGDSD